MNAAERLWRGLAAQDWRAVRSQLGPGAVVEWPHAGTRMDVEEYVARCRARAGRAVDVRRVVSEGRHVVVEAHVGDARCAGFYVLHDGLVATGTEYWIGEAG